MPDDQIWNLDAPVTSPKHRFPQIRAPKTWIKMNITFALCDNAHLLDCTQVLPHPKNLVKAFSRCRPKQLHLYRMDQAMTL